MAEALAARARCGRLGDGPAIGLWRALASPGEPSGQEMLRALPLSHTTPRTPR
jgi:hypothetical protein